MASVKGASAMASEPRYICAGAVTDGERAALARGDHQVVVAGEDDGEGEGPLQPLQRALHRGFRRHALAELVGDDVDDRLGIGVALEHVALGGQLGFELAEVLDDAVVHDRDLAVHVRMRVALGRAAVRCPARMADAGVAVAAAPSGGAASRLRSLPSARRRSRCPFSTVAMPAES